MLVENEGVRHDRVRWGGMEGVPPEGCRGSLKFFGGVRVVIWRSKADFRFLAVGCGYCLVDRAGP